MESMKEQARLPERYAYTAILERDDDFWMARFPDLEKCIIDADTIDEAIVQAGYALEDHLAIMEQDGRDIPTPTPFDEVIPPEGGHKQYVVVEMADARRRWSDKAINRTVTLPAWLDQRGRAAGLNFSKLLQSAVRQELGIEG